MIGTAIDLVIHLSSFGRPSGQVRRLANVAFVDENVEDSEGRPALFEFCRYHVLEDEWEVGEEGAPVPSPARSRRSC